MNIISIPTALENRGRASEYRERAAECRALAYEVRNEGARKELLDLAEAWSRLAEIGKVSLHQ